MKIKSATLIEYYLAPAYLVQPVHRVNNLTLSSLKSQAKAGTVKVLDREIQGWGSANAIIEALDRDNISRHYLADIEETP